MADTMEISSEHGHNGDEDIDIDIDFSAGHVDEDYVLEDAASNAGFGEEFHPQPSPAMGHDDLMIDGGDDIYSASMDEGADDMQDDDIHDMANTEHETLTFPSASIGVPTVSVDASFAEGHSNLGNGYMHDEVSWEANDEIEPAGNSSKPEDIEPYEESHQEDGDLQGNPEVEEVEAPVSGAPSENPRPTTPHPTSPKIDAVAGYLRSPAGNNAVPEAEPQDQEQNNSAQDPVEPSPSQDNVTVESAPVDEISYNSSIPEVSVMYRDSEYSLFSKSEADDIDSYFLSDFSIKDKPLSNFFEAIRDVIHDDLNDEDELCVSIEDLGLEVEETSSVTEGTTIGQIVNLYEKLLQNDDVKSVRPLCLHLRRRPNFSTRFANLVSGASDGKGFSELVQFDERSESFDDSAHVTENDHEGYLDEEDYDADDTLENVIEKAQIKVSEQQSSDYNSALHSTVELNSPEAGNVETFDVPGDASINGKRVTDDSLLQDTTTYEALSMHSSGETGDGKHEEDGDLIDYSDVEDEASAGPRKDARSHPDEVRADENSLHNAEYEAINENLRQRSISRTAENSLLDQAARTPAATDTADHEQEVKLEMENGIDYDENDGENFDGNLASEKADLLAEFSEDHIGLDKPEDDYFVEDGGVEGDNVDGGEIVDSHDLTAAEPANEGDQENFEEFDFGEDEDELPTSTGHETYAHSEPITGTVQETAVLLIEDFSVGSGLVFADAPDSESPASEKTLEAQPSSTNDQNADVIEENEDEINYDDDDELDALEVQEPTVKEFQDVPNGSAKRHREDDDGQISGSKEAKRRRS